MRELFIFENDVYNTVSAKFVDVLKMVPDGCHLSRQMPASTLRVEITTLDALIRQFGVPAYVTIDAEGHEAAVFQGLNHRIPVVNWACNLPQFADEAAEIVSRLLSLSDASRFNYALSYVPRRLESDEWLSAAELLNVVRSGDYDYMTFFCRSAVD